MGLGRSKYRREPLTRSVQGFLFLLMKEVNSHVITD
jgi:hypothetical protein